MAGKKKINIADLIFKIGDDGTLKVFEGQTKKAGKAVDKLGRSEATLNRNFKGASRQSSNQTKNFSKMAQGITGGLVPAYATLAANIFAIGAAFRFLQSAGDLRILQQGQAEYAQRTGQNLSIMTRNLQAATDGQLAFAEAAQSVAIATAAGLGTKQINDLGIVAKNASLMLGRDLTDSFNRLVRGAVKAEPELLDELGIILRLETASEKYALSIGKTKNQLNIFEKSQAVVNEVLEQGVEKFGGVETQANALSKLAKSFDDLVNSLKRAIGPFAEFAAIAMSQNTVAAAGVGLLAGSQLIRALTPAIPAMNMDNEMSNMRQTVGARGMLSDKGKASFGKLQTKSELKAFEAALGRKKSLYLDYTTFTKAQSGRMIQVLKAHNLQMAADQGGALAKMKSKFFGTLLLMKAEYGSFIGTMKFLGRGLTMAVSFLGWAGLAISVFGMLKQFMDRSDESEKKYKSAQKEFGNLFSQNAEDLDKMIEGLITADALMTNALQTARALSNIDYGQAVKGLEEGMGGKNYFFQNSDGTRSDNNHRFDSFLYNLMGSMGGEARTGSRGIQSEGKLSDEQKQGMEGLLQALKAEQTLLLENSLAYAQHQVGIKALGDSLDNDVSEEAFNAVLTYFQTLKEDGTIAGSAIKGVAQTTQIMTSSVQDFAKALNSFRNPQTQISRLTSNITSIGEAITGLGESYEKLQIKLKVGTGRLFDKGSMDILKTFLPETMLTEIANEEATIKNLQNNADQYRSFGDDGRVSYGNKTMSGTEAANQAEEDIAKRGSEFLKKYGLLTEMEGTRMHLLEMQFIKDKTKAQRMFTENALGATRLQTAELKKQQAFMNNQIKIADQELLTDELRAKGSEKAMAQLVLEDEKLALLKAQGLQLEKNLDTMFQMEMAAKNSFEKGMASGMDNLMTGKNSSFTENIALMGKGIFESLSKTLSDQMAKTVSDFVFGNKDLDNYQRGAEIIKNAHINGIRAGMEGIYGLDSDRSVDDKTGGVEKAFNIFKTFGFKKGGITPVYAANGGVFSGSNSGYPAMMHGNEAVVPLPDGKSIPISGGMGGNVTVNVSAGGAQTSTSNSGDMYEMGRSIAQAVQNELEKQQRPGGQLSPY